MHICTVLQDHLSHLGSKMVSFSLLLLAPLPEEEVEVGRLRKGQEEAILDGMRQRRQASFLDQTEVIELLVYVDKLFYDRYKRNRAAVEKHILAIMNMVCVHICV